MTTALRGSCCCNESSLFCSCPTNTSGYVGTACSCVDLNCNSPPPGLAACCTQVFSITASCDGMLYSPNSYSIYEAGNSTTAAMIPDTFQPGLPVFCGSCTGTCTSGASANDFVNFGTSFPCRTYPFTTPYMINRFMATPSNCGGIGTKPFAERYSPDVCFDASGCWTNAYLQFFVPTRYHGTYSASFIWKVGAGNFREPTVCNPTNFNTPNITRISSSSNCGMQITSFEIVCKIISGQAYFIVQLVWTPLMDATVRGPDFGGGSCTGVNPPTAQNQTNLAYGSTFSGSPNGCAPVPVAAAIVRYRLPVGLPASQPCGIRLGTYVAYEMNGIGTTFTSASLAMFPPITVA